MAINWGTWQNGMRLGIDVTMSPARPTSSTSRVTLTISLYGQMAQYYSINGTWTATYSGRWTGTINHGINRGPGGGSFLIHRTTTTQTLTSSSQRLYFRADLRQYHGLTWNSRYFTVPARPRAGTPTPSAPTGLSVTRNSDTRHTLNWSRQSTYTSVIVQRSENGGTWKQVGRPSGNAFSFVDTTTKANRQYRYRVRGVNAGGQSSWSGTATVYTTPAVPTGVSARRSGSNIRVDASGKPPYATSYDIRDNGTLIATSVQLPYTHTNPNAAVTHQYDVRAKRGSLLSAYSSKSAVVQLTAPPNPPTGLTNGGYFDGNRPLTLRWTHNPSDASDQRRVRIEYMRPADTTWRLLVEEDRTDESYPVLLPLSQLGGGEYGNIAWRVQTWGSHPDPSPWGPAATFDLIEQPGVAITEPIGDIDQPEVTVRWSWFQAQSRPQSAWELELLNGNGDLIEERSGVGGTLGERWVKLNTLLENGESYTVRVRGAAGDVWSEWDELEFSVQFIAPLPPTFDGFWNDDEGITELNVGLGDRTNVVDAKNRVINPSFESAVTTDVEVWRQNFPNPAFLGGERVLVWENRVPSPLMQSANSIRGWTGSLLTFEDGAARAQGSMYSLPIPVTAGESITFEFKITSTTSTPPKIALGTLGGITGETFTPRVSADIPIAAVNTEETKQITLVVPSGYTELRLGFSRNNFGIGTVAGNMRIRHITTEPGQIFDGTVSEDSDLTPFWGTPTAPGPANESPSRLYGWRPPGFVVTVGTVAIRSTRWMKDGVPTLRIISKSTSTATDAFVYADIPSNLYPGGVAEVYSYLEAPLTGSLKSYYASLSIRNPLLRSNRNSNTRGEQLHRIEFGALTDTYRFQMIHGGLKGSGDVWFALPGLYSPGYVGPWFYGDTSPDQDMESRWLGEQYNSAQVLVGQRPPGITSVNYGVAIKSTLWAAEGDYSARLIGLNTESVVFAQFRYDAPTDPTGALVLATSYITEDGPGGATQGAINITQPSPTVWARREPGSGAQELRLKSSPPPGSETRVNLFGSAAGGADTWFDAVGIFLEPYTGEWFDGDSQSVDTGLGSGRARWEGERDRSVSYLVQPAETVRVDVYRSLDNGQTWEPVDIAGPPASIIEDAEGRSTGPTLYRAIAFSEIGAAAWSEITVTADSAAVWLSGGADFRDIAALRCTPTISIDAGRERSIQRYRGRAQPVAYAGDNTSRVYHANGTLIQREEGELAMDRMHEIAQLPEPLHLVRDIDGRRIYGVLDSGLTGTREAVRRGVSSWDWDVVLTEADRAFRGLGVVDDNGVIEVPEEDE